MGGCCSDMITVARPIPPKLEDYPVFGPKYLRVCVARLLKVLKHDEKNAVKSAEESSRLREKRRKMIAKAKKKKKKKKAVPGAPSSEDEGDEDGAGADIQFELDRRVRREHKLMSGQVCTETVDTIKEMLFDLANLIKSQKGGQPVTLTDSKFERPASFVLTNIRILRRENLRFTQRVRITDLPSNPPQLTKRRKRALVNQFKKVNKSGSGEVNGFEMEMWLSRTVESIGDSVFLPMLFRVVPVGRPEHVDVFEWCAMYDKFCLMREEELLRFVFYQMAAVGKEPGQFPRIVVSRLTEEFPEFANAVKDKANTNRPLLLELYRVAGGYKDPNRPRAQPLTSGRTKHTGGERLYAQSLGLDPSELVSFAEYADISSRSKTINQALFYIHRLMRKDRFGPTFWEKRRADVKRMRRGAANPDARMSPTGQSIAPARPTATEEETKVAGPEDDDAGDALYSKADWAMTDRGGDDGSAPAAVGSRKSKSKYFTPAADGMGDVKLGEDDDEDEDGAGGVGERKDTGGDDGSKPAAVGSRKVVSGAGVDLRGGRGSGGGDDDEDDDGGDDGSKPARMKAGKSTRVTGGGGGGGGGGSGSGGPSRRSDDGDDGDDGSKPARAGSRQQKPAGSKLAPISKDGGGGGGKGEGKDDEWTDLAQAAASPASAATGSPNKSGIVAGRTSAPDHAPADSPLRRVVSAESVSDHKYAPKPGDDGDDEEGHSPSKPVAVNTGDSSAVVLSVGLGKKKKQGHLGPHSLAGV